MWDTVYIRRSVFNVDCLKYIKDFYPINVLLPACTLTGTMTPQFVGSMCIQEVIYIKHITQSAFKVVRIAELFIQMQFCNYLSLDKFMS